MDTFQALVEPNRRLLLESLRQQPCTVNMLVDVVDLSQPAVSKHLKVLKSANLVIVRQDGQKRWYELNAEPMNEVEKFLAPYRQFYCEKLDSLEQHLEQMEETRE